LRELKKKAGRASGGACTRKSRKENLKKLSGFYKGKRAEAKTVAYFIEVYSMI